LNKILLHICCGPCSTVAIERLKGSLEIAGFFYNPNIYPEEEYELRLENAKKVCEMNNVPFILPTYEQEKWEKTVKGYEDAEEGGERCKRCITMRLRETAERAKNEGFNFFGTTITVGPKKPSEKIAIYGAKIEEKIGIPFYHCDLKKKGGIQRSIDLSKEFGLYRQNYCGCRYSLSRCQI